MCRGSPVIAWPGGRRDAFVEIVKAFDTVPREVLFKVLARLGRWPRIVNLVRLFHENATLEVDRDDDGRTIIIMYSIGVKHGDTLVGSGSVLVLHSGGLGDTLSHRDRRGRRRFEADV
jgi:hypothetical protein